VAISTAAPYSSSAPDLVSLKEAASLFAQCGPGRTVDRKTLKRWAVKHGVRVERVGREDWASWSDLLEVHAKEIDRREADRP
jgi:hypothetical protein